jgi:hypothetical protein
MPHAMIRHFTHSPQPTRIEYGRRTLLEVLLDRRALVGGLRVVRGEAAAAAGPSDLSATW